MASPFEGMGAVLAEVLGGQVLHRPIVGEPVTRHWILRVYPDDGFLGSDHPVHSDSAELRVPRDQTWSITVGDDGDEIEAPDGTRYRITAQLRTPNPAADGLVQFQLEEITT